MRNPDVVWFEGEEKRMANWSVRVVGIDYGDMSSPKAKPSKLRIFLHLRNVSSEPQDLSNLNNAFNGKVDGLRSYFYGFTPTPLKALSRGVFVLPGEEIETAYAKELHYIEHRHIRSITISEREPASNGETGKILGRAELPLPPLDPAWTDPDYQEIEGEEVDLANWSARIVGMHYGSRDAASPQVPVVTIRMRNISSEPIEPQRQLEWQLVSGEDTLSKGDFMFGSSLVVEPGEVITIHAFDALAAGENRAPTGLLLTEFNWPRFKRKVELAKVEFSLPPPD
jgi:hypothetical protein